MPQVTDDQLEAAPHGFKDTALLDDGFLLRKVCEEAEEIRKQPEADREADERTAEPLSHVAEDERNHGDHRRDSPQDEELPDREDREEVIQRKDQTSLPLLLLMRFRGKPDDRTQTHLREEDFDCEQNEQHDDESHKTPEGECSEEELFNLEEPDRISLEEGNEEVHLVNQKLHIQERLEERCRKSPSPQRFLAERNCPGFGDDFPWSHWEGRGLGRGRGGEILQRSKRKVFSEDNCDVIPFHFRICRERELLHGEEGGEECEGFLRKICGVFREERGLVFLLPREVPDMLHIETKFYELITNFSRGAFDSSRIEDRDCGLLQIEFPLSEEETGEKVHLFPGDGEFGNGDGEEHRCAFKEVPWRGVQESSGKKLLPIEPIHIVELHRDDILSGKIHAKTSKRDHLPEREIRFHVLREDRQQFRDLPRFREQSRCFR